VDGGTGLRLTAPVRWQGHRGPGPRAGAPV